MSRTVELRVDLFIAGSESNNYNALTNDAYGNDFWGVRDLQDALWGVYAATHEYVSCFIIAGGLHSEGMRPRV